jgi:hypothetical protein
MKKFLFSRQLEKAYFITAAVGVALTIYGLLALEVVKISCRFYKSYLHQGLEISSSIAYIISLILFLLYAYGVVKHRSKFVKWKKMLLVAALVQIIFSIMLYFAFVSSIFYCFFDGVDLSTSFYWGPH